MKTTLAPTSDQLLEDLVDISLTGVIFFKPVYTEDGKSIIDLAYVRLNPAAQRMLQLPQCPQETFLTLYPHALQTGIFAFYRDTFLSGKAGRYDVNYSYDGLDNYFYLSAKPSGQLLIVSFDDTAHQPRTAVEVALRESQAREKEARTEAEAQRQKLKALLEQSPVGIGFFQGPDQVVTVANQRICEMWGYLPQQVLGRPLLEGVPELKGQGFDGLIREVFLSGVPYRGQEVPAQLLRNGQLVTTYYNFVFQPLYDGQGSIMGVIDVVIEVTDLVKARKQVQQLNEELAATNEEMAATNEELMAAIEELYKAKNALEGLNSSLEARVSERTQQVDASNRHLESANGQLQKINNDLNTFVYTASHDLKAPIVNIEGLLTALQKRLGPEAGQNELVKELLGLLNTQVNRFKSTIEALTDVARIGKESAEDIEGIELAPVLAEVLEDLDQARQQAAAQIEIELDHLPVQFSRKNLKSVFYNLLSNAIKYRCPERQLLIKITSRVQGDYYVLSVQDNGLGVNTQQGEKMFTLFKRFHTHVPGTGIGLHIVKKMVENAEGKIEVESQVGIGSTFSVYFKRS